LCPITEARTDTAMSSMPHTRRENCAKSHSM
jgi:hypothetical protein